MSDKPDLSGLAGRYLDLWQDQLALLAGGLARSGAEIEKMGAPPPRESSHDEFFRQFLSIIGASAGPASLAFASAAPGHDAVLCARRIAALEDRILRLEAQLGRRGGETDPPDRSGGS